MERRLQIAAHMRRVADEDAAMAREEIRLLKSGTLRKGTHRHKAAFLLSIEKDLEAMIKDEEDPSEDDAMTTKELPTFRIAIKLVRIAHKHYVARVHFG
jgi:hypothetical protein